MNESLKNTLNVTILLVAALTILRIFVGWHFLYEGITKVSDPTWSAAAYLAESRWILSGFFHWIVATPSALKVVNFLNAWGLLLIGLGLFLGLYTRFLSISGAFLLLLYYIVNPPFVIYGQTMATEGSYMIVDKNFIEMCALIVLAILPRNSLFGLDTLGFLLRNKLFRKKAGTSTKKSVDIQSIQEPSTGEIINRRVVLRNLVTLPLLGVFAYSLYRKKRWQSMEEKHLLTFGVTDAITSSTIKTFHFSKLEDLKGELPYGKIGNLKISRLFIGGNLIGGWAHARDLIYVSKLVKAYHTDEKVIHTLRLAEKCGINTLLTNPQLTRIIHKYWNTTDGNIKFISDCALMDDLMGGIRMSIDAGAHACYSQGGISDKLVDEGKVEEIGKGLDLIRQNGLPAGIGAHYINTIKACVEAGIKPDFWVKSLHHHKYWSAQPDEYHDNKFCYEPEETIEFMKDLEEPWIAFKVLAAGAIQPEEGFTYAFNNGADFICVGMYDFQIIDDVNITLDVLSKVERNRPWRA